LIFFINKDLVESQIKVNRGKTRVICIFW